MKYLKKINEDKKYSDRDMKDISDYIYNELSEYIELKNYEYKFFSIILELKIYHDGKILQKTSITILYETISLIKKLMDKFDIYMNFDNDGVIQYLRLNIREKSFDKILNITKTKKYKI